MIINHFQYFAEHLLLNNEFNYWKAGEIWQREIEMIMIFFRKPTVVVAM